MSDEIGKKVHKQFVQDRLIDKTVSFHAPVKKQNLKTFCKSSQNFTSPRKGKKEKKETFWGNLLYLALQQEPGTRTKGAFQKSELAGRNHGQTRHFGNEIGFFQEVLLKNHFLCAKYLGFD